MYLSLKQAKLEVDIDREIRSAGWQAMACGVVGGMPGNIVCSYSSTVNSYGVKFGPDMSEHSACKRYFGRQAEFSLCLTILSLLFFIFGDYIVAFLPCMSTGLALIWMGWVR